MKVKSLDLSAEYTGLKSEIDAAIQRVLNSGMFILGQEVQDFEQEMADYLGVKHVIGVGNGTDALQIAYMALGLQPGDELITTPFTFYATVEPMLLLGLKPVFVDIDPVTYNLDPAQIEAAITAKTKAIVPVHLYGLCADMNPIMDIARQHRLAVIEDSAQAIGATYQGKKAGTIGHIATFSFFPSKNLGAYGDGGMITTHDDDLADKAAMIRVHGAAKKYYHDGLGVNSRLDALQAAIILVKLKYIDQWNQRRRDIGAQYSTALSAKGFKVPVTPDGYTHIFHQYTLESDCREALMAHLKAHEIGFGIHYPVPLHQQKALRHLGYRDGDLPYSEKAANGVLSLPIYPQLTDDEVAYVVDAILSF